MRRRTLLTVAGTMSFGGCLSGGDEEPGDPNGEDGDGSGMNETDEEGGSDDTGESEEPDGRRYEECSREIIAYETFPEDVQREIDGALEGGYESERVYLKEAMDVDGSYVSVEGSFYDPTVHAEGGAKVLTLERIEPKALPRPRPVSVELALDGEREVTVEIVAEDGTVLLEESRQLHPGGDVEFGRIRRVGTHELRVTVIEDGEIETETTDTVRISESRFDVIVVVESDDVLVTGTVAELVECRFET